MQYLLLITPTVCAAIAGVLAWGQRPGWGWFLFAAIMLYPAGRILGTAV